LKIIQFQIEKVKINNWSDINKNSEEGVKIEIEKVKKNIK
jgi:hypothetical protein